jgi:hypothetical protein
MSDELRQQERPDAFLRVELSDHAQCFDEVLLVLGRIALFSQMLESQCAERRDIVVVGSPVDMNDESRRVDCVGT